MKWERWHGFAAAGILLLGGVYALGRYDRPEVGVVDAGAPSDGPPAKVPEDLLAELYIASPNTTWTKLQRGIGGAVGILPATMPGVVVALSDLDAQISGELDGTAPIYAGLAGDPGDPGWVIAMKLVEVRRARGLLLDGDTSRFSGKDAPGMTLLMPKRVASPGEDTHQVAITTNGWLVVARRATDLPVLGNWVTRGLTSRPVPTQTASAIIDLPRSALSKSLAPKLKSLWENAKGYLVGADERMRAERGGRAPDFGDPAAIVAAVDGLVGRRIAVVGDLEAVRIQVDVTDDAASLQMALTPTKEGAARAWIDGMRTGDAAPVLALPASSVVALSMRDDETVRTEQGKSLEATISSVLGPRLKDPAPLHAVIESATKARGEAFALGVALDEPSGLILRAPVRDAAAAKSAFSAALDLAKIEPFKELLRLQSITSAKEELPGIGTASVATLVRMKPDAGAAKHDSGIAWYVDDKEASAALGGEPAVTLRTAMRTEKKLADEPALKRFVDGIGTLSSTVIIAQPLRLDPKRANLPMSAVSVAIGKREGEGFVRIDVPDTLLREVTRWQMGF